MSTIALWQRLDREYLDEQRRRRTIELAEQLAQRLHRSLTRSPWFVFLGLPFQHGATPLIRWIEEWLRESELDGAYPTLDDLLTNLKQRVRDVARARQRNRKRVRPAIRHRRHGGA